MIDRTKGLKILEKTLVKDGSMYRLDEQREKQVLPTGVATLDAALGVGGFVRGSQNIIYGRPSAGKSALAYTAIREIQRRDPEAMCCIVDIERSADKEWLAKFGIDISRIVIIEEETIELCVNAFQQVMRANVFDFILVDSLGAVIRAVDLDGKDGKGGDANVMQVGGPSKVITSWVSKANGELIRLDKMENAGEEVIKPVIIYINQVRDNLSSSYGGFVMPGGHAKDHMAGVILRVTDSKAAVDKKMGTNANGMKVQVGSRVNIVVEKNKYAPPLRMAGYDFIYEECDEYPFGVDSIDACASLAIDRGVVKSSGAWLYYPDPNGEEQKANGKAKFVETLRENPELYKFIYEQTMDAFALEAVENAGE